MTDTVEKIRGEYDPDPHNPFQWPFVGPSIAYVYGVQQAFPEYFPEEMFGRVVSTFLESVKGDLFEGKISYKQFDQRLRANLLLELSKEVNKCERCELSKNRCSNSLTPTSVFGEGAIDPAVMLVNEGPGNYEARTGIPMVGSIELRMSPCSLSCANFEACYVDQDDPKIYVKVPTHKCSFKELPMLGAEEFDDTMRRRMYRFKNAPYTAGELLNHALGDSGLVRHGARLLNNWLTKLDPFHEPINLIKTNVYITNAVRCRNATGDPWGPGNEAPTKDHIAACNPFLEITIKLVKPGVIVALGKTGLMSLSPLIDNRNFSMERACPNDLSVEPLVLRSKMHNKVVVGIHPAYIMREGNQAARKRWEDKLRQVLNKGRELGEQELSTRWKDTGPMAPVTSESTLPLTEKTSPSTSQPPDTSTLPSETLLRVD